MTFFCGSFPQHIAVRRAGAYRSFLGTRASALELDAYAVSPFPGMRWIEAGARSAPARRADCSGTGSSSGPASRDGRPGKSAFAPNADVYEPDYYERMYRPHWLVRNRRKYEERDAALLRIVRPAPSTRVLEVGSARGDTAFFFAPRVGRSSASTRRRRPSGRLASASRPSRSGTSGSRRPTPATSRAFRAVRSTSSSSRTSSSTSSTTCCSPASRAREELFGRGARSRSTRRTAAHWAERIKAAVPGLQQADHIAVRPSARVVALVRRGRIPAWTISSSPRARIPSSARSTARSRWSASAVSGRASGR